MQRLFRFFSLSACFILLGSAPLSSLAQTTTTTSTVDAGFNPHLILQDHDLFELGGMSLDRIQRFLESKRGVLARIKLVDADGVEKTPAEIIWRVATSYHLNPKYLLALIQKEQSLVEDPDPKQKQFDWATGYAVCDSCSYDDPSIQQFKGFASQIEWAAKQHREKYLQQLLGRGATISGMAPGKPRVVDGQTIIPANLATAMLYTYTPHIHGNLNLWRVWQRWFSLPLPDGTVAREKSSPTTYLIRFGEKHPYKSRAVLSSMVDPEKVLIVDDGQLGRYPLGKEIRFSNYSLVETPESKRYLIADGKKRLIANQKVFTAFGFNEDEVEMVETNDLADYADGPDITLKSKYPTGLLAKDAAGRLWYVEDGTRRLIPDKAVLTLYFKGRPAKLLTQAQLTTLTIGSPYRLRDGELVKAKNDVAVYVIENGSRRPIISGALFEAMGWKWKNVVTLSPALLKDYPLGEPVQSPATITLASQE